MGTDMFSTSEKPFSSKPAQKTNASRNSPALCQDAQKNSGTHTAKNNVSASVFMFMREKGDNQTKPGTHCNTRLTRRKTGTEHAQGEGAEKNISICTPHLSLLLSFPYVGNSRAKLRD